MVYYDDHFLEGTHKKKLKEMKKQLNKLSFEQLCAISDILDCLDDVINVMTLFKRLGE